MEKEMQELYIEGIANHDDPEPCADAREGAAEAFAGADGGWAIRPRNPHAPRRGERTAATIVSASVELGTD
jgi:hypothetical protein